MTDVSVSGTAAPRPQCIMIGGSNTGMKAGYTQELKEHYGESGAVRHMLGASTSLFGLANIQMRDLAKPGKIYVFEYALNDISYHRHGAYQLDLLEKVLREVVSRLTATGSKMLLLLFSPRYTAREVAAGQCPVTNIYKQVGADYGVDVLDITEHFVSVEGVSEGKLEGLYTDEMHYNTAAFRKIGKVVVDRLEHMRETDFTPRPPGPKILDLKTSEPHEWSVEGPHEFVQRQTSVFGGRTLRLYHGATVTIPMNGAALGMVANTTLDSGYIRVEGAEGPFLKNLFDGFVDGDKPRIFLKQLSRSVPVDGQLRLTVDANLTGIPSPQIDYTMHETAPRTEPDRAVCELLAAVYQAS